MTKAIHPAKQHKGGKAVSWSLIGLLLVAALIGGILQLVNDKGPSLSTDSEVVSITTQSTGNKNTRQPISTKIEATSQPMGVPQTQIDQIVSYEKVWERIDVLALGFGDYSGDGIVDEFEKKKYTLNLLATLNFDAVGFLVDERRGEITSSFNGNVISPDTIYCYLNGYVPNKPYLKPNCPSY